MQQAATTEITPAISPTSHPAPGYKYWRGFFQDVLHEHGYRPMRTEGTVPEDLKGAYYQNGPANFSTHRQTLGHIFTGDGLIRSVREEDPTFLTDYQGIPCRCR